MEKRAREDAAAPPSDANAGIHGPRESPKRSPKRRRSFDAESGRNGREPSDSPPDAHERGKRALEPQWTEKKQRREKGDMRRSASRMPAPMSAASAPIPVFSEATTREIDAFVTRCAQWQERLTDLSGFLSKQVAWVEQEQVASVLREMVTRVEVEDREVSVCDAEMELRWGEIDQQDAVSFAETLTRARFGAQEFEAMERQLVEDRVLELETQLQQKRANEKEKERELANLRADHDELLRSSAGVSKSEWEKLVAERDALLAKMRDIKAKYKQKSEHMSRLKDEVLSYKFQNADLTEECRTLREQKEAMMRDAERQQEEIDALKEQLEAAERRRESDKKALDEEKGRREEAEEHKKRDGELSAEFQRVHATLAETVEAVATKTSEIAKLHEAKTELERELAAVTANEASSIAEAALKRQAAEKELLQEFFKRYYHAAEKKCGDLMRRVSELQKQTAVHSQQARESLEALRTCTQVDTCDDTTRATLLDVVSVLERSVS